MEQNNNEKIKSKHSDYRKSSNKSRSRSRSRNRSQERHRDRRSRSKEIRREKSREKSRSKSRERYRNSTKDRYDNDRHKYKRTSRSRSKERRNDNKYDNTKSRNNDQEINSVKRKSEEEKFDSNKNDYSNKKPRYNNKSNSSYNERDERKKESSGSYEFEANKKQSQEDDKDNETKKVEKEKPNFEVTGKLASEENTYKGVVLKYSEPPEARKTKRKWRLHVFKGDTQLEPLPIHRQSGYLFGRDRLVADIPIDHPSCSKQHAVLQYRQVQGVNEDGEAKQIVKPYLIDLESSNGTYINNQRIEASRYYELQQGDVIKFGFSTRDYILLDEDSV